MNLYPLAPKVTAEMTPDTFSLPNLFHMGRASIFDG